MKVQLLGPPAVPRLGAVRQLMKHKCDGYSTGCENFQMFAQLSGELEPESLVE